jgi:acyl-coenzyme A thioesterase PaaI-like protein
MQKPKTNSLSRMQWMLRLMGCFKIPMIGYVSPKLLRVDDEVVEVKIRLRRRTKNHLNSMYFGALAVGADIAAGIHAFYFSEQLGSKVSFAFKAMQAEFLKRGESDIVFVCGDGALIRKAVEESRSSGERINQEVMVEAMDSNHEIVARFTMTVSVKVK